MRIPKKFKIDKSGKSQAIFLNKNNNFFDKFHLSFLKKYYIKKKKRNKNMFASIKKFKTSGNGKSNYIKKKISNSLSQLLK